MKYLSRIFTLALLLFAAGALYFTVAFEAVIEPTPSAPTRFAVRGDDQGEAVATAAVNPILVTGAAIPSWLASIA